MIEMILKAKSGMYKTLSREREFEKVIVPVKEAVTQEPLGTVGYRPVTGETG